jgi:nicotinamidase-related amidase
MSHPVKFLSLLLAATFPLFVLAQDNSSPVRPKSDKSVLLVVDAQRGVLGSVWESKRVIGNLEKLVGAARLAGVQVIWVQHSDNDELKYGSEGWKFVPSFVPTATEIVVHKKYNSSFASTDLDQRLKALGVSRIILVGALTNWCLRSTAYAAMDRGYNLTLVSDAHSTEPMKLPNGTIIPAASIVADLNAVIEWVSVPNVRTEVKKTADVAF